MNFNNAFDFAVNLTQNLFKLGSNKQLHHRTICICLLILLAHICHINKYIGRITFNLDNKEILIIYFYLSHMAQFLGVRLKSFHIFRQIRHILTVCKGKLKLKIRFFFTKVHLLYIHQVLSKYLM